MNTERFIAQRLIKGGPGSFSAPVIRIAIISVALGLAVMIVSIAIVTGFQRQIREKITGFGSHIQVAKFDSNNSFEYTPINRNQPFYQSLPKTEGIKHIQVFATKAGIIKTKEQIQGVVFKGVGADFDWSFFNERLVSGEPFSTTDTTMSTSVIISKNIADLLKIKLGDPLRMYSLMSVESNFQVSSLWKRVRIERLK